MNGDLDRRDGQDPQPGADPRPGTESRVTRPRRTEAEFDAELRRVARSMIREELPREILDPALSPDGSIAGRVRTRRALPGFAAAASSVVVLLLATAVALAPGTPNPSLGSPPSTESLGMQVSPKPTRGPVLRSTDEIRADLRVLGYTCNDGPRLESPLPGPDAVVREAAICEGPKGAGPFSIAVVVGEALGGRVTLVNIKSDVVGEDTPAARDAIAQAVAKAAGVITIEKGAGSAVSSWVAAKLPTLEPREGVEAQLGGLFLRMNRSTSGAILFSAEPL